MSALTDVRTCSRCKSMVPVSGMKKDIRNTSGYSSECTQCHQQASVKWQQEHPETVNDTRRRRYARKQERINRQRRASSNPETCWRERICYLYKASASWYAEQLDGHGGACAMCKRSALATKRRVPIDHDHACCLTTPTCGKCTRGMLCHPCNVSLHSVERDRAWLASVVQYLNAHDKSI